VPAVRRRVRGSAARALITWRRHEKTSAATILSQNVDRVAEKRVEGETERDGYIRQEIVSGNFYRQIPVGEIDPNAVKAQVENGVLTVTLPAPTEPQPVKIAISSWSSRNAQETGNAKQPTAESA